MDKLVAQYSRPPHQNEFYSEQEQRDLTESLPPISLKFNLPPVDNVSHIPLEAACGDVKSWEDCSCRCLELGRTDLLHAFTPIAKLVADILLIR